MFESADERYLPRLDKNFPPVSLRVSLHENVSFGGKLRLPSYVLKRY